jgi:uncharacterized protein YndB with AHSA1/START domain
MATLPGDELIPVAVGAFTHAITIGRPPRAVWPWLAQMGAGSRAGWYSYDELDNGRKRSADEIQPELQEIAVGTLFPALPGETGAFHVLAVEPERHLVLGWAPKPGAAPSVTWAFVLQKVDEMSTRLITRARGGSDYSFHGLPRGLGTRLIRAVHFVMERKQLLEVARRAERVAAGERRHPNVRAR